MELKTRMKLSREGVSAARRDKVKLMKKLEPINEKEKIEENIARLESAIHNAKIDLQKPEFKDSQQIKNKIISFQGVVDGLNFKLNAILEKEKQEKELKGGNEKMTEEKKERKHFDEDTVKKVLELYAQGKKPAEICKEFNGHPAIPKIKRIIKSAQPKIEAAA